MTTTPLSPSFRRGGALHHICSLHTLILVGSVLMPLCILKGGTL